MRVITMKAGDVIFVGDDVTVVVKEIDGELYIEVDVQNVKLQEKNYNNMLE